MMERDKLKRLHARAERVLKEVCKIKDIMSRYPEFEAYLSGDCSAAHCHNLACELKHHLTNSEKVVV